ncbi:RagB/SusD family nutrient uptake outer membrane protein [Olivibacter sp. SDN3]|uniref:RagB/SusD family nutrient uptake outer membrane protein n=1 Tax=Olivibacter sp. SDN3 TaxID=2764720 RepID=UPI001651819C|nr:RagB/SusD family nutrient uptake outer membrane protein [Olivibacter sp. SDN3]QNL47900.1 RagB/SusD family nutrient uptake outer membrane protein [Olivibacter sp. SDN3]
MKLFKNVLFIAFLAGASLTGCNKLIEINTPKNLITPEEVFNDSVSAHSALSNVYAYIERNVDPNLNKYLSLYVDDLNHNASNVQAEEFFRNSISLDNGLNQNIWSSLYSVIYQCNAIIEHMEGIYNTPTLFSDMVQNEAIFLRAFAYLYLVSIYDNIPLVLETNVNITAVLPNSTKEEVYSFIIADLLGLKERLEAVSDTDNRTHADKWATSALLARAYLQQNEWERAVELSTEVIQSGRFELNGDVNNVFFSGSNETILQFWTQNDFISDAASLLPSNTSVAVIYALSDSLVTAFGKNDLRKANWINTNEVAADSLILYPYAFKYKNRNTNTYGQEFLVVLRLAEQFLIRAEAKAHLGQLDGPESAWEDLNRIRLRAGLESFQAGNISQPELLLAIEEERRREFFMEWGHRFMDLKRTERLSEVVKRHKGNWTERAVRFPIPQNEISFNPNLKQNEGY